MHFGAAMAPRSLKGDHTCHLVRAGRGRGDVADGCLCSWGSSPPLASPAVESSSNTATAPSSTTRCAVSLRAEAPSVGAAGGTVTVALTVNRECLWEAGADVEWITLASARAGQGNATLTYAVSPNRSRRSGVAVWS